MFIFFNNESIEITDGDGRQNERVLRFKRATSEYYKHKDRDSLMMFKLNIRVHVNQTFPCLFQRLTTLSETLLSLQSAIIALHCDK